MMRWRVMFVLACCAAMSACAAKTAPSTKGEDKKSREVVEKDGRDRAGKGGGGNGAVAGGGSATGGGAASGNASITNPSSAGDATKKAASASSSASASAKKPDASPTADANKSTNAAVDQQSGKPAPIANAPAGTSPASSTSSRNNNAGDALAKTSKKDAAGGGVVTIGGGASKIGDASPSDKAAVSSDKFATSTRHDASVVAPSAPSMSLLDRVSPAVPSAPASPQLSRVPAATPAGATAGSSSVGMTGVKPSPPVNKTPEKPVSINASAAPSSDPSAAPATPSRLAWDTLLASPVSSSSSPSIAAVSADTKGDLPRVAPQARAEAIAALKASNADRVAVWSASSPKGVSLPRQEAIDRLEASGDEKVIAVALIGNDSASWQGVIDRINAERIRAEWFTREAMVKGDDIDARREKLATEREAERQGQRNLGDAFYRTILGEPAKDAAPKSSGDAPRK